VKCGEFRIAAPGWTPLVPCSTLARIDGSTPEDPKLDYSGLPPNPDPERSRALAVGVIWVLVLVAVVVAWLVYELVTFELF